MTPRRWSHVDRTHLLQKIILLQLLNQTPEKPSETNLSEWKAQEAKNTERVFDLQREKELAESFAFLAATTDDPKKVVAACVEEGEEKGCVTVRLEMNHGNLDRVVAGFERMGKNLEEVARREQCKIERQQQALLHEAIALNQNRILNRLRSRHAMLKCSFKKNKVGRPQIIPQLYKAINQTSLAQISGAPTILLTALLADVETLYELFTRLENLTTPEARSSHGLEILIQIVIVCQQLYGRRILHQVLAKSPLLEPGLRTRIAPIVTKLSRYFAISRFLLQAARKYPVFRRVRVSAVCFKGSNLPATELDSFTADLIHNISNGPKLEKLAPGFLGSSPSAIKDHICKEATLAIPVHAEVQLLFHYEQNYCNLPPRIMCSSKQACFLCALFFKIHGKFTVPSTHGRLYEKWALPNAVKNMVTADGHVLKTLRSFVSAIEMALLDEIQSSSKSYPAPYESIILHSAVCSQSNQSATSIRGASASQRPTWCEDLIPVSKNDSMLQPGPARKYAGKSAVATTTESKVDAPLLSSEISSATTIRAPSPSKALPANVNSLEESVSSNSLHISLAKGQLIWRKLSSIYHSFEVRTPRIHLIISPDEFFRDQWSQRTSHEFVPTYSHYWVILEYLSDRSVQQDEDITLVNLHDVPNEREMTLDYGSAEGPRKLHVCSNNDVLSITYSSREPVEGLELRN